jgi:hypothetical protein
MQRKRRGLDPSLELDQRDGVGTDDACAQAATKREAGGAERPEHLDAERDADHPSDHGGHVS